jgi:thioredoxin-like negative regulator of GroEL
MQDKFGPKGLSILAVTDEGASETEKWVRNKGAQYAYAYDKGGKLARHFGVNGIPHAVLVNASGTVVWKGHPGALEATALEEALVGALPKPLFDWSAGARGVKSAFVKRSYKSALEQAQKLAEGDGGPEIVKAIQATIEARVSGMKSAYDKGDFLGARNEGTSLSQDLAGLPELESATKVLADLAANKEAANVIKGQEKVAKIRGGGLSKRKEVQAALESLQKIAKEYSGTYAEKEANELIRQLGEREM